MTGWLTRAGVLWALLFAFIALTLSFGLVMRAYGFQIIDEMHDPALIEAHIAAMTDAQRRVHVWITATLDVAYPFVYGGLFAGMALRFFGKMGPWLALPSLVCIPVDLAEGLVQVLALLGTDSVLWLKAYLTPAKLVLFIAGGVLAIIAAGVAIMRLIRQL